MVKTEKIVKHTICCPHCGSRIKSINEYELDFTRTVHNPSSVYSAFKNTCSTKVPTCTSCKKKFAMKIDTENFTIEIKDI